MTLSSTRKKPERMCMSCRAKKEKRELFRVVRTEQGVVLDLSGKMQGRGAYICKDASCIEQAIRKGRIRYQLKAEPSEGLEQLLLETMAAEQEAKTKANRKSRIVRIKSDGSKEEVKDLE